MVEYIVICYAVYYTQDSGLFAIMKMYGRKKSKDVLTSHMSVDSVAYGSIDNLLFNIAVYEFRS